MTDHMNGLELEFHLATLLQDLRLLGLLIQQSRKTWLYTVQPLQAHASALCSLILESSDEPQRAAIQELFTAVLEIDPPTKDGRTANEAAWAKVKMAQAKMASAFAGRCKPWLIADPTTSTAL